MWNGDVQALGLGGGSGVVPLMSMLRHAAHVGQESLLRLAVSARTRADLPYADELEAAGALIVLTREDSAAGRPRGRLAAAELRPLVPAGATCYVCGSQLLRRGCQLAAGGRGRTGPERAGRTVRAQRLGPC